MKETPFILTSGLKAWLGSLGLKVLGYINHYRVNGHGLKP